MSVFRMNVKVKQKGQIFNASQSKAAAKKMIISINEMLAQEGVRRVRGQLKRVLKNPTGFYESKIIVDRREIYRGVSDSHVSYGGWLEGVDARNKTTRFKGYRTFRTVKQQLDQDKEMLARPFVNQFIKEMNG